MNIIPAIDIMDGKCVRLIQGDYARKTVYSDDPVALARQFEAAGLRHLHLVDLDGARSGRVVNVQVLKKIADQTRLEIDYGGGIRSDDDMQLVFENGAGKVTLGSIAVQRPGLVAEWQKRYGAGKIILGADCRNGQVVVHGWQDTIELDVADFMKSYIRKGIRTVMCTDVACDGMLSGPSIQLYKRILAEPDVHLIASGGIRSCEDLDALKAIGCKGAIIGKALYEGRIQLSELRNYAEKENHTLS